MRQLVTEMSDLSDTKKVNNQFGSHIAYNTAHYSSLYIAGNKLVIKYNYPLRSHSMVVYISFDRTTKKTQIICEMSGVNEYSRFDKIIDYLDVTSAMLGLTFDYKFEIKPEKVTWLWEAEHTKNKKSYRCIGNDVICCRWVCQGHEA